MADPRFERLANLVTYLAHSDRPRTMREIVATVPGYGEGESGRRKAFERDKKMLREEGIDVVEEDGRYRIADLFLPDLDLTDDERAALNVAVAAVPVQGFEPSSALAKLGGVSGRWFDADVGRVDLDELPLLPVLHAASRRRQVLEFEYENHRREFEPFGLLFRDGFWYVHGHDRSRGARRTFRVDRIADEVVAGPPGEFEPPPDVNLAEVMPREPWQIGGGPRIVATVVVDGVMAGKVAAEAGRNSSVELREDGTAVVRLPVTNRAAFRSWVLGLLDHVTVEGPDELRSDIVDWLRAVAGEV